VSAPQTYSEQNNMTLLENILGKEKYASVENQTYLREKAKNRTEEEIYREDSANSEIMLDYLIELYEDNVMQSYLKQNGPLEVLTTPNIKFHTGGIYHTDSRGSSYRLDDNDHRLILHTSLDAFKAEVNKNIVNSMNRK